MKTFFETLDDMHRFTMNLDCHREAIQCRQCCSGDHLVSHGFVYCHRADQPACRAGKRLFCSNRHGRRGCGATLRLYLNDRIPGLHYSAACVTVFVLALIAGSSIQAAYCEATAGYEPRNGSRWFHRLCQRLMVYRQRIERHAWQCVGRFGSRTKRLRLLLPSLAKLFDVHALDGAAGYQMLFQDRLF